MGKHDDDSYEVAIDPPYLLGLRFRQCQMIPYHNPTQPGEIQKAIYGINNATKRARDHWLQHATDIIRSKHKREIKLAFFNRAQSYGLYEELARTILIHDIRVSYLS